GVNEPSASRSDATTVRLVQLASSSGPQTGTLQVTSPSCAHAARRSRSARAIESVSGPWLATGAVRNSNSNASPRMRSPVKYPFNDARSTAVVADRGAAHALRTTAESEY